MGFDVRPQFILLALFYRLVVCGLAQPDIEAEPQPNAPLFTAQKPLVSAPQTPTALPVPSEPAPRPPSKPKPTKECVCKLKCPEDQECCCSNQGPTCLFFDDPKCLAIPEDNNLPDIQDAAPPPPTDSHPQRDKKERIKKSKSPPPAAGPALQPSPLPPSNPPFVLDSIVVQPTMNPSCFCNFPCRSGTTCCCDRDLQSMCLTQHDRRCHYVPAKSFYILQRVVQRVECAPCAVTCNFAFKCCCTLAGTRCEPLDSADCLYELPPYRPPAKRLLKKGVPDDPSIKVTRLSGHFNFKVAWESGPHDLQKDELTSAVVFAISHKELKQGPYLSLGESKSGTNAGGSPVTFHEVRFQLPKQLRTKRPSSVYYRVGVRLEDKREVKNLTDKEKDRRKRFYDKTAWQKKIAERRRLRAGDEDDPRWFSESDQIQLRGLLQEEEGWLFSSVMSVSVIPSSADLI